MLDVFVQVACFIARGGSLGVIGKEIQSYKQMTEIQPKINSNETKITGSIIYIDNYGNVISNISKKLFTEIGKGRDYKVVARRYSFDKINKKYNDIINYQIDEDRKHYDGNRLALFNSAGFIEIAVYRSNLNTVGGASSLLGLNYRDTITVEFY